jgi:Ras GTPase-activating-like protein IQGAP2/3
MVQSFGYPQNSSIVSRAVAAAAANNHHSSRNRGRGSKRYSVSVFYSMAAEQDVEIEDELAKGESKLNKTACRFVLTRFDQLNAV